MRVPRPVGKGVMTAVDGDPADDLPLEAHRPRDGQHDPQRRRRREAAVGEQPVEADGHPQPPSPAKGTMTIASVTATRPASATVRGRPSASGNGSVPSYRAAS